MNVKKQRRKCKRFTIPGATLRYKLKTFIFFKSSWSEDVHPILEISLGGLSFLSQKPIAPESYIEMLVYFPDDKEYLIKSIVKRTDKNNEISYAYKIAVKHKIYGDKADQNSPDILKCIKKLEKKYLNASDNTGKQDHIKIIDEFSEP